MKREINYRPKYSLSIKYLALIMPDLALQKLIDRYIEAKKREWKISIKGKK